MDKPSITVNVDAKEVARQLFEQLKLRKEKEREVPLLQIELADINSVPTVYYKGEEIEGKLRVSFDWKTNDEFGHNTAHIHIEHVDSDSKGIDTKTTKHNQPLDKEGE